MFAVPSGKRPATKQQEERNHHDDRKNNHDNNNNNNNPLKIRLKEGTAMCGSVILARKWTPLPGVLWFSWGQQLGLTGKGQATWSGYVGEVVVGFFFFFLSQAEIPRGFWR